MLLLSVKLLRNHLWCLHLLDHRMQTPHLTEIDEVYCIKQFNLKLYAVIFQFLEILIIIEVADDTTVLKANQLSRLKLLRICRHGYISSDSDQDNRKITGCCKMNVCLFEMLRHSGKRGVRIRLFDFLSLYVGDQLSPVRPSV